MKINTTISIDSAVLDAAKREATAQRRSLSNLIEVIIEEALHVHPETEPKEEEVAA